MKPSCAQSGFTLLELLMVVAVVGVMAGLTVMSISGQPEREFRRDVARIQQLLMLAQDEAQAEGVEIGVVLAEDASRYAFYYFDAAEVAWVPYEKDLFHPQALSPDYRLSLESMGEPVDLAELYRESYKLSKKKRGDDKDVIVPWLVFFSDGDYTPFRLWLSSKLVPDTVQVLDGDGLGDIQIRQAEISDMPEPDDD